MGRSSPKSQIFWPLFASVLALDVLTKALAVAYLSPQYVPHEVLGNVVRLTLAYNPGASFGIGVGPYSRGVFILLALVAVVILVRLYRGTDNTDRARGATLALILGGALGNMLDRVRSWRGVVDFIDLGISDARFYTFNVADIGITAGAIGLAIILWREDRRHAAASVVLAEQSGAHS
jgi:signal peptidase II